MLVPVWSRRDQFRTNEGRNVKREVIRHRGVTVFEHGARWRFKWQGKWVARNTLAGALEEADRLIDQRSLDRYAADITSTTISQLLEAWWPRKRAELRESSRMRYEGVMRLHIEPRIGYLAADALRAMDAEDYYSQITYKTALVSRDVLRPAFRWGMTNGVVRRIDGTNPFELAKLNRSRCLDGDAEADANTTMQVDERLIPTRDEIEKLLSDAEERGDWTWWLYLRLAPTLGARPGEQCALQRRDLEDTAFTVSITKAANPHTLRVTAPKRPASVRTLYVGRELFADIAPLLRGLDPDDWLFPATGLRNGERKLPCWNTHGVSGRLARAAKRTGIQHYVPHSLRHFCATYLLDAGWPPMQVARWLGHRNDTMVRLLYAAHIVEETRIQIGEAAGRLIRREAPERNL